MDKGKLRKRIIAIIVSFIFLIALAGTYLFTRGLYQRRYFKELSLELTGIVTAIETDSLHTNLSAIYMSVLRSNKNVVDQQDSLLYYYCILKNDRAVIFQSGAAPFSVGDTLYINTNKQELIKYNKGQQQTVKTALIKNKTFLESVRNSSLFKTFFNS